MTVGRRLVIVLVACVAAAVIGTVAGLGYWSNVLGDTDDTGTDSSDATVAEASTTPDFESAMDACGADATGPVGAIIGDDGTRLILQMETEDSSGISAESIYCFLDHLQAPDETIDQIVATSPFDGTQEATWDQYRAEWTTLEGLSMSITRVS